MKPLSNRWSTVGGQQQPILAVELLLIAAVAPRLDVAGDQVLHALDPGDAAGVLDRAHVVPKLTLTTARLDERGPLGLANRRVGGDRNLNASFPFLDVPLGRRRVAFDLADLPSDIGHARSLIADQRKQRRCQAHADLRQVDGLQSVALRGKRGVLAGQVRAQSGDMILRTDGVGEPLPADADPPADLAPVHAGGTEFLRLRALQAVATDNAKCGNSGVEERENNVPGSDLTHELVEGIAVTVLVALGRPQIAALDLLAEGPVLIDPPIAHALFRPYSLSQGPFPGQHFRLL